jgi:hypothetical protein
MADQSRIKRWYRRNEAKVKCMIFNVRVSDFMNYVVLTVIPHNTISSQSITLLQYPNALDAYHTSWKTAHIYKVRLPTSPQSKHYFYFFYFGYQQILPMHKISLISNSLSTEPQVLAHRFSHSVTSVSHLYYFCLLIPTHFK